MCDRTVDSLACLREQAAQQLAADLRRFVNNHLFELIASNADQPSEVDVRLGAITQDQQRYLAHADLARAIADLPATPPPRCHIRSSIRS